MAKCQIKPERERLEPANMLDNYGLEDREKFFRRVKKRITKICGKHKDDIRVLLAKIEEFADYYLLHYYIDSNIIDTPIEIWDEIEALFLWDDSDQRVFDDFDQETYEYLRREFRYAFETYARDRMEVRHEKLHNFIRGKVNIDLDFSDPRNEW